MHVQLWDHDRWTKDDLIGEAEIRLGDIVKEHPMDEWYDIQYKGEYAGKLHLRSWQGSRKSREEEEGVDEAVAARRAERRKHKKGKKEDSSSSSSSSSDEERDIVR